MFRESWFSYKTVVNQFLSSFAENSIMNVGFPEIENIILEEYSFISWQDVKDAGKFDLTFERAVNAVLAGDTIRVREMIRENPELVSQKSQFGPYSVPGSQWCRNMEANHPGRCR